MAWARDREHQWGTAGFEQQLRGVAQPTSEWHFTPRSASRSRGEADGGQTPRPSGPFRTVAHRFESGILQSVGVAAVVRHAQETDAVIELVPRIGDLVATGSPIFRVYGGGQPQDDAQLQRALAVGDERTMKQDPAFVFRLFADISSKALSPGVSDPTTSVQALDKIDLLLREVAGRQLNTGVVRDDRGAIRFWRRVPSWEDLLTATTVHSEGVHREGSVAAALRSVVWE